MKATTQWVHGGAMLSNVISHCGDKRGIFSITWNFGSKSPPPVGKITITSFNWRRWRATSIWSLNRCLKNKCSIKYETRHVLAPGHNHDQNFNHWEFSVSGETRNSLFPKSTAPLFFRVLTPHPVKSSVLRWHPVLEILSMRSMMKRKNDKIKGRKLSIFHFFVCKVGFSYGSK